MAVFPARGQDHALIRSGYNFAEGAAGSASLYAQKLHNGVNFYKEARWNEALRELRIAQDESTTASQLSEALYWIALSELAVSGYEAAFTAMDLVESLGGDRRVDIAYHRGRAYYYLGYYEEAISLLNKYIHQADKKEELRKSAAAYWIGECYFSLGQIDKAKEYFQTITTQFHDSAKYEAAVYRLSLINQKRVEQQLLEMLRWSHEETLKTNEEFLRREKIYDQALNIYQKQIAEYQQDTRLTEMEAANNEYRRQLAEAQAHINTLVRQLDLPITGAPEEIRNGAYDDLMTWAYQLRTTMYEILLEKPDITILYGQMSRLDQFITGADTIVEEELAAMELTLTLLKAQYNL